MGSTLTPVKSYSFFGVKGGVGTTLITSLLGRLHAFRNKLPSALIDPSSSSHSPAGGFLSISNESRSLSRLLPYRGQLTPKMTESFFSTSPEGLSYVPFTEDGGIPPSLTETLPFLGQLGAFFDRFFIDLSPLSPDQRTQAFESGQRVVFVSSFDPVSLSALKKWENILLESHYDLSTFGVLFTQANPSQLIPRDLTPWTNRFHLLGTVPQLGENLAIQLMESTSLPGLVEKTLTPILEKLLDPQRAWKTPSPRLSARPIASMETSSVNEPLPDADAPPFDPLFLEQVHNLHQKLLETLRASGDLSVQQSIGAIQREKLEPKAREALNRLVQEMDLSDREIRQRLVHETLHLAFGLGPLEPLLQDESITEIMVNGPDRVYIERKGKLERTSVRFFDEQQLRTILERILAPIGRRIDESQPYVDGRLLDGSRVNVVIPPLSLNGPALTIRKFSKQKLTVQDLIRFKSITQEAADFLGACVQIRKNIVVSGGTGSGKTTLLNILSHFIPNDERIVTIEDSAELQLSQDHVVRLEGRPANIEGKGRVNIRDLVINALRMRPDRIVVGECRGGEALDMLQAMNTGHDGSLTTAHANSPRDVLSRLETMSLLAGLELPLKAIREQIARAVHLVVQQSRLPSGKRVITQISEIQGMEGDVILLQDLFVWDDEKGGLVRKPFRPSFADDLKKIGYTWPAHQS